MKDLQFPVGISNFEKIREGGNYYIDKTNLISELLSGGIAEVTLITRPRRFGKSQRNETRKIFWTSTKEQESNCLRHCADLNQPTRALQKWMNQCLWYFALS